MLKFFNFRGVSGFVTSLLCTLSMFTVPVQTVSANDCCCEEDTCCSGFGRDALIIGGAAVVGGVAGYLAGHSRRGHGGDSGSPGDTGPVGPVGPVGPPGPTTTTIAGGPTGLISLGLFAVDVGEALTFTITSTLTAGLPGGVLVTPYVAQPNGVVLTGPTVAVAALGLIGPFAIVVPDPVFGTYHVGLQVVNTGLIAAGVTVDTTVFATRDGSTTTIIPGGAGAGALLVPGSSQIEQDFTYGPEPIP